MAMELLQGASAESFVAQWLPAPTQAEVAAPHTHHSHARRYRSREAPLKYALQRIADDGAQRPVMQQWLRHVARACPGSLYLPQFDEADILSVLGCARGSPNASVRDAMLASTLRRGMADFASHELSWDGLMSMLLGAEPLVLRVVVDDRATATRAQGRKRARDDEQQASTPVLLDSNLFQFRLLALAIWRFRGQLQAASESGRVLPVLISITWYNPVRSKFHAHMCALSIEATATPISADGGLVALLHDPIPTGIQAGIAERARAEIVTLLRYVLTQQCGGVQLLISSAFQPQNKLDPRRSPLCAPYSLLFLHARGLGLPEHDYGRVFRELKQQSGLSAEDVGLRYANRAARVLGNEDPPQPSPQVKDEDEPDKQDHLINFVGHGVHRRRSRRGAFRS